MQMVPRLLQDEDIPTVTFPDEYLLLLLLLQHHKNKAIGLTTPRRSNPPFPDSADLIFLEIQVSQRCALCQHSCKTLCPSIAHLIGNPLRLR